MLGSSSTHSPPSRLPPLLPPLPPTTNDHLLRHQTHSMREWCYRTAHTVPSSESTPHIHQPLPHLQAPSSTTTSLRASSSPLHSIYSLCLRCKHHLYVLLPPINNAEPGSSSPVFWSAASNITPPNSRIRCSQWPRERTNRFTSSFKSRIVFSGRLATHYPHNTTTYDFGFDSTSSPTLSPHLDASTDIPMPFYTHKQTTVGDYSWRNTEGKYAVWPKRILCFAVIHLFIRLCAFSCDLAILTCYEEWGERKWVFRCMGFYSCWWDDE